MIKNYYKKELIINNILKNGSSGMEVEKIQEWINLYCFYDKKWKYSVVIDGKYGPQTENTIIEFQKTYNLNIDGIVGSQTFSKLCMPLYNAFTFNPKEKHRLSTLIIKFAEKHLYNVPHELNNSNEGPWVRSYLDGNEGNDWPWCMGFAQTILDQAFDNLNWQFTDVIPHTYSCDVVGNYGLDNNLLIRNSDIESNIRKIKPGSLFLKVKSSHDWFHTGIITSISNGFFYTIEGNTNDEGEREGYEVCRRIRSYKTENLDIFLINL